MRFSKKKLQALALVVALVFCGAAAGFADEAGATAGADLSGVTADLAAVTKENKSLKGKVSKLEKQLASIESRLSKTETMASTPVAVSSSPEDGGHMRVAGGDINVNGFIDTSFNWNFQSPEPNIDGNSTLRAFDDNANTFDLNNVQIEMSRPAPESGGVGFKTVFMHGSDAAVVDDVTLGFEGGDDEFAIQQAYLDINLPNIGNGLTIWAGKFATLQGAEVIENHLNWNSSRAFLFNLAIPFTHTGVRVMHDFLDGEITTALGLVNGWDQALDNNDIKDIEGRLGWNPSDVFSTSVGFMVGSNQDGDRENQRGIVDVIASWTPLPDDMPDLQLMVNYDYGWEEDEPTDGDTEVSDWQGYALYARYGLYDWLTLAARWEQFFDENGVRTGLAAYNSLWEMTYTADIQVYENLLTRLEYRYDHSNSDTNFDNGTNESQTTLGASMIYLFG